MKKYIILLAMASLLFFVACEDRSDLTAPSKPSTGDADFAKFVTIGNSLTAGYQSGSLYESSQVYSLGKIIADQVGTSFEQPIISEPGIPGKLELHNLAPTIIANSGQGLPTNSDYQAPYNNLGVPGATVSDLIDETDFAARLSNPYFYIILRSQAMGKSVVEQALALQPTFINLWIGNNDVLGYATSGGINPATGAPSAPTAVADFKVAYDSVALSITDGQRNIVAANIPDVQSIPFFTTIGPKVGAALVDVVANVPGVDGLVYQMGNYSLNVATPEQLMAADEVLLTLVSSPYASLVGKPTGKFYRELLGFVPPGVDTTQAFGLHPQNPWPNVFTLDAGELAITKDAITSFNGHINATVNANPTWALVDINAFFADVADGGMMIDGIQFTTSFILGNTFSLDGVHPTTRGYAVIANEFIKVINTSFNASIPRVNVSTYPASISLAN